MKNSVSVLMTVFNGMPYLKEAVESILCQTLNNFQFVIIDDCSSDGSFKYLSQLNDNRILLKRNDKNIGQVESLNKGIDLCKGKYIARLDQDDVNMPKRLEEQLNFFHSNKDVSLICSYEYSINENGNIINKWTKDIENYGQFLGEIIIGQCPVWHPSVMYKKKIVNKLGKYDVEFGPSEDYDLWSKFAFNRYNADIVKNFHLKQRLHGKRQSITKFDKQLESVNKIHLKNLSLIMNGDLNIDLSKFLLLEKNDNNKKYINKNLKMLVNDSNKLFNKLYLKKSMNIIEQKAFEKTISKRLGYGIFVLNKKDFLPSILYNIIFYSLSPSYFLKTRKIFSKLYHNFKELLFTIKFR